MIGAGTTVGAGALTGIGSGTVVGVLIGGVFTGTGAGAGVDVVGATTNWSRLWSLDWSWCGLCRFR